MPLIESFIENLLEMRSHYQARVNQCDRLIAHAQEGLAHINALLVDEALDSQQFATNLLQMRSHYQTLVDEQKRRSATALEQLVHINALLAEQMAMQHRGEQTISMQATAYTDNPVLTESIEGKELPIATEQLEPLPATKEQVKSVEKIQSQQSNLEPEQANSSVMTQGDCLEEVTDDRLEPLPLVEIEAPPASNSNANASQPKTPLLPPYQHLSRSEAVEKLLQENIGTILHTDYIIRSLYGNLEKEAVKVEKQRLNETLGKGVARGLWDKVPDQPGCYTIDLKLVDREVKSTGTNQATKSDTTKTIEVLPAYQHLN